MSGIFCVVQWDQSHRLRPMVEKAIEDMCSFDHLRSAVVLDEENICVGSVFRDRAAGVGRFPEEIEVTDGVICSNEATGSENVPREEGMQRPPADGLYNALVWRPVEKVLRVTSDIIGAKPLYFWTNGTILVLSSELKTFRLFPFIRPKLNYRVLAATLVFGYPLDEGTLLDGIEVLPLGHGMMFQRGKATRFPLGTWRFTRERHQTPEQDLVEELESVLAVSTAKWMQKYPHTLVSLSGGLDSRTALGFCLRQAEDTIAATWGMPGSEDFLCAEMLARRADCPHMQCIVSADRMFLREELERAPWQLESFNAVNLPFYSVPWFQFLMEHGRPVVLGYLADSGSGDVELYNVVPETELDLDARAATNSLWSFAAQSSRAKVLSKFSTPKFLKHLTVDLADGLLDVYGQFDSEHVYQRLIQTELYTRTRRWIGHTGAPKLCEVATAAVLPFYTRAYLDFYASVPLRQLRNRWLFRQMLLKVFPKLARVREAGKWRPPVAGNLLQYAVDRISGSRKIRLVTGRKDPIASTAVFDRLVESHRRILTEAIGDVHELVSGGIDMQSIATAISKDANLLDRETLIRLYNVSVFLRRFYL